MNPNTKEAVSGPTEDIIIVSKAYGIDLGSVEGWMMIKDTDGNYLSGDLLVGTFSHSPKDIQSWTVVGKEFV